MDGLDIHRLFNMSCNRILKYRILFIKSVSSSFKIVALLSQLITISAIGFHVAVKWIAYCGCLLSSKMWYEAKEKTG
jgi:hypothetical protein